MSRLLALALLFLAASGARGQRLYLPDGARGVGADAGLEWASGGTATGVGLVASPLARVDVRLGVLSASARGRTESVLTGEVRAFVSNDPELRVYVGAGATGLVGSDDALVRVSAGAALRSEAGPRTVIVPRAEVALQSISAPRIDPVPVFTGGMGVATTLGDRGPTLYAEPSVAYTLTSGQVRLIGHVGASLGF